MDKSALKKELLKMGIPVQGQLVKKSDIRTYLTKANDNGVSTDEEMDIEEMRESLIERFPGNDFDSREIRHWLKEYATPADIKKMYEE